jgi:ABC-2 type transport system permease protein
MELRGKYMNNNLKKSLNTKYIKMGGYSMFTVLAVIAIAVAINFVVGGLPSTYTKYDTSSIKMYTISDETAALVRGIDTDITMYFIAENGREDTTISELLHRFADINPKIKLEQIDPITHPTFTAKYTAEQLSASSVIIESAKRTQVIDYYDIYVTGYDVDQITGQQSAYTAFAGESRIMSGLEYVNLDTVTTIYTLSGHGESAFSQTMAGYITSDNIDVADLNLIASDTVPSDANAVMINTPTVDISEAEAAKLLDYLKAGGSVMIISSPGNSDFTNLYSIGKYYGIDAYNGLVIEGGSGNFTQQPYYLLPKLGSHEIINSLPTDNMYVFTPFAIGLKIMDTMPRTTLNVTPVLLTTDAAYLKTGEIEVLERADGDMDGPFAVMAAAEEAAPGGKTSKLVWYASFYIADESADLMTSGNNSTFFLTALTWSTGKDNSVAIATKRMQVMALNVTSFDSNIWGVILIGIIPLAVLLCGLRTWYKRSKR